MRLRVEGEKRKFGTPAEIKMSIMINTLDTYCP